MRIVIALLCLFAMPPLPAQASPWPRTPGTWFMATTLGLERSASGRQRYSELYAEYGANDQLTLATQLRHTHRGWRADLLARWHPGVGTSAPPFAFSAGVRFYPGSTDQAFVVLGANVGQGFDTPLGNVWTRLDVNTLSRADRLANPVELSLSGQAGLRSGGGLLALMTITAKRRSGETFLELSPQIGHEIGRRHTLLLGVTTTPTTPRQTSAQLSLWSRF